MPSRPPVTCFGSQKPTGGVIRDAADSSATAPAEHCALLRIAFKRDDARRVKSTGCDEFRRVNVAVTGSYVPGANAGSATFAFDALTSVSPWSPIPTFAGSTVTEPGPAVTDVNAAELPGNASVTLKVGVHGPPGVGVVLAGNTAEAVRLLETAANRQDGPAKALSLYYRGAILNGSQRFEEALPVIDQALTERPDLATALEEKGEALWQLGRRQKAVEAWTEAVRGNSSLPLANNFLAGAAAEFNFRTGASGAAELNLPSDADRQQQALRAVPANAHFHWMLGLRLKNLRMNELAERHFTRATELNPAFHLRRGTARKDRG